MLATQTSVEAAPFKSRERRLREQVKIVLASDANGPAIAAILKENGIEFEDADWSRVYPHWLIATLDDEPVACLQVLPSKPIGYLEYFFARPSLPVKARIIAMQELIDQGWKTLMVYGASYCVGSVDRHNQNYQRVLEKYRFAKIFDGAIMAKRLIGKPRERN